MNKHVVDRYTLAESRPGTYQLCFSARGQEKICYNTYDAEWYWCSGDFEQAAVLDTYPAEAAYKRLLESVPKETWAAHAKQAMTPEAKAKPAPMTLVFKIYKEQKQIQSDLAVAYESYKSLEKSDSIMNRMLDLIRIYSKVYHISADEVTLDHLEVFIEEESEVKEFLETYKDWRN